MKQVNLKCLRLLIMLLYPLFFGACDKDNLNDTPPLNYDGGPTEERKDKVFARYAKEETGIVCRYYFENEDLNQMILSGLKENHIWLAVYNRMTQKKILEWQDTQITNPVELVDGKTNTLSEVRMYRVKLTEKGFIATLYLRGLSTRAALVFKTSNNVKRIENLNAAFSQYEIRDWYEESAIYSECCYRENGDTLFFHKFNTDTEFPDLLTVPISYDEGISPKATRIQKFNYDKQQTVWRTRIKAPYLEEYYGSYTYKLLDKTTHLWKYQVNALYENGSKKSFVFVVNIDNGVVKYE